MNGELTLSEKQMITQLLERGVTISTDRLGKLSGTQWGVMSSSIKEMSVVRMLSWFTRAKNPHYAVHFRSDTSLPLEFLILFGDKSAEAIAKSFTRKYADKMSAVKELIQMSLGEVANIVAQSVLGVLADEYDASIILSTPTVRAGDKAQLVGQALEGYDGRTDTLLLSHVDMFSENLAAECSMVIIVNSEAMKRLLSRAPR